MKPLIAEKAKEQEVTHTEQDYQKSGNPVHTDKELARAAGVPHDTIHKAAVIDGKADEETKDKSRSGETTCGVLRRGKLKVVHGFS